MKKSSPLHKIFIMLSSTAFLCLVSTPSIGGGLGMLIALCLVFLFLKFFHQKTNEYDVFLRIIAILGSLCITTAEIVSFVRMGASSNKAGMIAVAIHWSQNKLLLFIALSAGVLGLYSVYYFLCHILKAAVYSIRTIHSDIQYFYRSQLSFKQCKKNVLTVFIIILLSIIAGTILLSAVYYLPTSNIDQNVNKSSFTLQNEGTYPRLFLWCNSKLDNYTDSIMLLEAANQNSGPLVEQAMIAGRGEIVDKDPCEALVEHYRLQKPFDGVSAYPRYWHGYLLTVKPLLSIMDYSSIRLLNAVLQGIITISVILLLWKNGKREIILPYCTIVLMLMPIALAKSLQFSTCFYIMNLGMIAVLLFAKRMHITSIVYLFSTLGIMTAFFDFLTFPIITLGMPLLILICCRQGSKDDASNNNALIFRSSLYWGIGYVGMWSSKWVLASWITKSDVLSNAARAFAERASLSSNSASSMRIRAALQNLGDFAYTPAVVVFAVILLVYIVKVCKNGASPNAILSAAFPYMFIGSIPIMWYLFAADHSWLHSFYTCKSSAVLFFAVLLGLVQAVKLPKKQQ